MRWGFHQVLLSERAQKIFTFVAPFGTFSYQRLVMGYVNATAEFQRHMNNTLGPLLWDTCLSGTRVSVGRHDDATRDWFGFCFCFGFWVLGFGFWVLG